MTAAAAAHSATMDFDQLLATYGYLAIALGSFLEGETMLLLGGFAAQQGRMDVGGVMLAGFAGGIAGDQLYFLLARCYGTRLLDRRPRWRELATRIESRWMRHRDLFILGFRFLYGLRVVSPILIGLGTVSAARYALLNVIGGTVWAVSVTLVGTWCGRGVQALVDSLHVSRLQVLGAAVLVVLTIVGVRMVFARAATPDREA